MADNANFDALARALLDMQARTKDLSDNLRQLNTAGIAGKSDGALAKEEMETHIRNTARCAGLNP